MSPSRFAAVASLLLPFIVSSALAQEVPFCHPGIRQLLQGDIAGAARTLQPTAAESAAADDDLSSLLARGITALLEKRTADATELLDRAVALRPQSDAARFNRGLARLAAGELEGSAADFEAVASLDASPLAARAGYHRALIAARAARWADAERWSRVALHHDPLLPDARLMLGYALERQSKWADAGQEYKTFIADYPSASWAMVRFGVTALRAGFPDTARAWLRRASQADPGSLEAAEARKYLVMLE